MSTLHTVNKSPFEKNSLEQCIQRAANGGSLILIEDGVTAAVAGNAFSARLADASKNITLYVLASDLAARGFADAELVEGVSKVDYTGFVDLVTQHERVHSWL